MCFTFIHVLEGCKVWHFYGQWLFVYTVFVYILYVLTGIYYNQKYVFSTET
jgi:thiosulfate reductase cytochrome b subunit